jgi:hypothetical protein
VNASLAKAYKDTKRVRANDLKTPDENPFIILVGTTIIGRREYWSTPLMVIGDSICVIGTRVLADSRLKVSRT